MALFVLGDTHLSLGASKPMDIFPGWDGYLERLERNWRKLITPQDTIVFAGAARPEAHHERQPRLLVDHSQQDERLPQGGGL